MAISRRHLLRRLAAAAAGGTMVQSVAAARAGAAVAEPPASTAKAAGLVLRLNRNENAYGPSPGAIAAMQEASRTASNRYPETASESLRTALAEMHGVRPEEIVL